jgi:kanamycin kinase
MSIPAAGAPVPARVRELAAGATLEPVWRNELGGVTFRAEGRDGIRFIKHGPKNLETTSAGEAERLSWAREYTPVPRVIEAGADETHEWLVTVALPGASAVAPRWVRDPATAVRAIGRGLRAFHDRMPVAQCPFDWRVSARTAAAEVRGIRVPDDLRVPPAEDRLVVCHGDACAPNTLIADDGSWAGHVDLGALGVGDLWADLAVAAMSTVWNYGPGWEEAVVDAYGVPMDAERMTYYQRLWNAT